MAKTNAPLLGFGASGSIADTLVYAKWRGIPYARQRVIPANPNTTAQQLTRNIFRTLSQMWKQLPANAVLPWNSFATGRPFLGSNAFTGQNMRALRDTPPATSMELFIGSPGSNGGLAPSGMVLTPGADSISAALAVPVAPDGWTITRAEGIAFPDQAPDINFEGPFTYAQDAVTPYELSFTGLTVAGDYVVAAWLMWEKPDGKTAYSISLTDTATPA